MDRRTKVELLEQIRREYTHGAGTIQGAAECGGSSAAGAASLGETTYSVRNDADNSTHGCWLTSWRAG
jgi:hypothetical protein